MVHTKEWDWPGFTKNTGIIRNSQEPAPSFINKDFRYQRLAQCTHPDDTSM